MIFHGPPGSGKYTRAILYLERLFGKGVRNVENSTVTIEIKGKPKEVEVRSSTFHVEIIPSNTENDKEFIQGYVKSLTQNKTVSSLLQTKSLKGGRQSFFGKKSEEPKRKTETSKSESKKDKIKYRVVMIFDADHLSSDAQDSLRRTMEKGNEVCRFILLCHNADCIIQPLRSRCVMIRVPSPSPDELKKIIKKIGGTNDIVPISRGNIRIAEACAFEYEYTGEVNRPEWQLSLDQILKFITTNGRSNNFEKGCRDKLFDVLTMISEETVMNYMFIQLMESDLKGKESKKIKIPEITAQCVCLLFLIDSYN